MVFRNFFKKLAKYFALIRSAHLLDILSQPIKPVNRVAMTARGAMITTAGNAT